MHPRLKKEKEKQILDAVEKAIAGPGILNLSMNEIATAANITKVTLYNYFQSKENLYLAIMHRAFEQITENYYQTIDLHRDDNGLDCIMAIYRSIFQFFEKNQVYSDAMLDYFSLIRKSHQTVEFKDEIAKSLYFIKLQDLQNLPLKLTAKQIARGKQDGSIKNDVDPMLHAIQGWSTMVGYIKLLSAAGKGETKLYNVNLKSLKDLTLSMARDRIANSANKSIKLEVD